MNEQELIKYQQHGHNELNKLSKDDWFNKLKFYKAIEKGIKNFIDESNDDEAIQEAIGYLNKLKLINH
jgi:hypothetical protein